MELLSWRRAVEVLCAWRWSRHGGPKDQLDWFKAELEKRYELTEAHRLGPGPEDDREARVLNRIVRWTDDGIEYEADPRHQEIISLPSAHPLLLPNSPHSSS